RNRARFRLRFGIKKTWLDDQIEVGFRLASGSDDDPTSTNQSFDNFWSTKPVWIDLAYATWRPKAIKGLTVTGGNRKTSKRIKKSKQITSLL
ncbi:MAG: putative porin, partial [Pirellulaceae bacterium]